MILGSGVHLTRLGLVQLPSLVRLDLLHIQLRKLADMANLRFDGRVALVTGAGGGLGREYALLFAERGASVVVNDLGGDIKGAGKSQRAADKVVSEIRAKGGKAVPNYDSVEDGEKLVKTALDNFGRIDIVINNAGILRDRSFARTSDLDWDLVHRVHLRGAFQVSRAAWPHMKNQKYGRMIFTTSSAGLYGNFGQANYSAAKLGLVGLCNTLAVEGAKYNINCNSIAPFAGSRLTETVMTSDMVDALKPFYIAPIVAYLCHDTCNENGGIFECGAGWYAKLRYQRSKGVVVRKKGVKYTPEEICRTWDVGTDFEDPSYPSNIQEANSVMVEALHAYNQSDEPTNDIQNKSGGGFNPSKAIGFQFPSSTFTYSSKDAILYALGVGVSTQQEDHLKFLFELNENFCVLPSYGVIPAQVIMDLIGSSIPGLEDIDVTKILHGEQYLELHRPLPSSATFTSVATVIDILDKGSGALIVIGIETFDESEQLVAYNQFILFLVGSGNFGGKRNSDKIKPCCKTPSRAPDASIKEVTSVDQAALYRLSGDRNPLHIDPTFAAMGGLPQPILHGLCSFGYATRHVLKQFADNDVSKFKAIKVRFSKPVLPGQTIQTDMWKEGNRILIQCQVAETGSVVLSGGYIELTDVAGGATTVASSTEQGNSGLQSEMIFNEMGKQLAAVPDLVKKVNGVFLYNITVGKKIAGKWTVVAKAPSGEVYKGEPKTGKADCTVTIADEDFVGLVTGKLVPQQAFMAGKLKVKGNIMLLQKAGQLFQQNAKL
ncbi:peroxisomal multifunctional enzyme type 2-like [Anneissia japonica]|uniref:peroxisomal multifunctional enzyme type 2-like n=1 Tax=Anneissia japonica TaxID=1529436 RepID=UPI00142598BD|nr:peroxisomal multifunctional enzyme type 2-like [Anneissia japonica]